MKRGVILKNSGIFTTLGCRTKRTVIATERKYYTYILRCSDGVLYTGYTVNLAQRLLQHNNGKGAKFTRGRGPVEVVYFEIFPTKSQAMTREIEIKRLTRIEKLKLISGDYNEPG